MGETKRKKIPCVHFLKRGEEDENTRLVFQCVDLL